MQRLLKNTRSASLCWIGCKSSFSVTVHFKRVVLLLKDLPHWRDSRSGRFWTVFSSCLLVSFVPNRQERLLLKPCLDFVSYLCDVSQVCGPLKSWKRAAGKGFGFAEFESAEGVLRAMRLLKDLPVDGQELLVSFEHFSTHLMRRIEKLQTCKAFNVRMLVDAVWRSEEQRGFVLTRNKTKVSTIIKNSGICCKVDGPE